MPRPTLLTIIPHSPAFDSCFPLIERLHRRGRIATRTLVGPRLRQVEPRVEQAFARAGVPMQAAGWLRSELFCLPDILRATAVLTHSDPVAYGKPLRPRDAYLTRFDRPVIMVQHGMTQAGLHRPLGARRFDFFARKLLLWQPIGAPDFITRPITERSHVTGLIKVNRLGPHPGLDGLRRSLAGWRQTVLICHNFGFEGTLFSDQDRQRNFAIWAQLFDRRPDTLFLLRGHRGKRHSATEADIAALCEGRANVLRSERHDGLMRMATIHDVMAVCDRVITHPSTVVLDAIYDGLPVGVFDAAAFPEVAALPQLDSLAEFERFLDNPDGLAANLPLRRAYGEPDANLDLAAGILEDWLESLA